MRLAPTKIEDRITGEIYRYKGEFRIWAGCEWNCLHNKRKDRCGECNFQIKIRKMQKIANKNKDAMSELIVEKLNELDPKDALELQNFMIRYFPDIDF